jgi:hypothetical protein
MEQTQSKTPTPHWGRVVNKLEFLILLLKANQKVKSINLTMSPMIPAAESDSWQHDKRKGDPLS